MSDTELFEMIPESDDLRCPVERDEFGCSLPAGHDGVHRAHVSHDLSRAYTPITNHTNRSTT